MVLEGGRKPELFHSYQGCQFTSSVIEVSLQAEKNQDQLVGQKALL